MVRDNRALITPKLNQITLKTLTKTNKWCLQHKYASFLLIQSA